MISIDFAIGLSLKYAGIILRIIGHNFGENNCIRPRPGWLLWFLQYISICSYVYTCVQRCATLYIAGVVT